MTASSDRQPSKRSSAFPRPLKVEDVPTDGLDTTIEATPEECEAIAHEFGLPDVMSLAARFRLAPRHGGRLEVEGELTAHIAQICVVSLERFESGVAQPIEVIFAPAAQPAADPRTPPRHARRRGAIEAQEPPPIPPPGDDDPPDPIVDGRIDLGATAVEFLALALDFYPRKPGVHFKEVVIGETDEPQPSAFAALERLKDRS